MKVSYVTTVFPVPSETFAGVEVRLLRKRGIDVSVHALGPPGSGAAAMLSAWDLSDLKVTHGTAGNLWRGLRLCIQRPALPWGLVRLIFRRTLRRPRHLAVSLLLIPRAVQLFAEIERERPDVVHLYWGHFPSLVGYLVLERLTTLVLSSSLSAYDLGIGYGVSRAVAPRADFVRTWARANVPDIEALGVAGERIEVVYQGFDFDRLSDVDRSAKVRRRVVSAGRLVAAKRMDDVVKTFHRVLPHMPDASLVILGDGPERARLERLARGLGLADAVLFRGHVSHDVVLREMAAAEVFLFMSCHPHERLPNVVKEAIAMDCLCIVTDTPGMEELIRHDEDGFVLPQRDVEGAARCLQEVLSDDARYARIKESGYSRLRQKFAGDTVAEALESAWRRAAHQKSRRATSRPPETNDLAAEEDPD